MCVSEAFLRCIIAISSSLDIPPFKYRAKPPIYFHDGSSCSIGFKTRRGTVEAPATALGRSTKLRKLVALGRVANTLRQGDPRGKKSTNFHVRGSHNLLKMSNKVSLLWTIRTSALAVCLSETSLSLDGTPQGNVPLKALKDTETPRRIRVIISKESAED